MENEKSFELVYAEFFDQDALKVAPQVTYRLDNQGERLYARKQADGTLKIVPSVTTILNQLPTEPSLIKWHCDNFASYADARKYVNGRASYGTFMHMLFKEILLGNELVFSAQALGDSFANFLQSIGEKADGYDLLEVGRDLKQDLWGFVQWCKTYEVKPLAIEYIVFGEFFAGAVDLVCEMTLEQPVKAEPTYQEEHMFAFLPSAPRATQKRRVIAMIDFKSGRNDFHESHRLQLEGYRTQWNREWPEHKVEVIANYGCKDYKLPLRAEPYRFKPYKDDEAMLAKWTFYVSIYHLKEVKIKDRSEFVDNGMISLAAPLAEMVKKIDVEARLLEKMGEDENGRKDTQGSSGAKAAGDRESQGRPKGANGKRKGAANQSGLF